MNYIRYNFKIETLNIKFAVLEGMKGAEWYSQSRLSSHSCLGELVNDTLRALVYLFVK